MCEATPGSVLIWGSGGKSTGLQIKAVDWRNVLGIEWTICQSSLNRKKAKKTQIFLMQEMVRMNKPVAEAEGWDLGEKQ